MKSKFLLPSFIVLYVTLTVLSSCENSGGAMPPPMSVRVMKFKNPEYKDYILANCFQGEDFICAMRFNRYEQPIGKAGYSPYWELPDNWLLVDWKWGDFPYNAGLTILTELTWDKFKVDSTNNSHIPRWPLSEPHVLQPLDKIYYVQIQTLKEYSGTNYNLPIIEYIWCAPDTILKEDTTNNYFESRVDIMDSIWTVLQRDLSVAIENGDLEHINDAKYNSYR